MTEGAKTKMLQECPACSFEVASVVSTLFRNCKSDESRDVCILASRVIEVACCQAPTINGEEAPYLIRTAAIAVMMSTSMEEE